jgi:putative transposase
MNPCNWTRGSKKFKSLVVRIPPRIDWVTCRQALSYLFVDNGSEFSGRLLDLWAHHHRVRVDFSRPGKPIDNCFIETFNGSFRDDGLNLHWFESLEEAKMMIEAWRRDCNVSRPHTALHGRSPAKFSHAAGLYGPQHG